MKKIVYILIFIGGIGLLGFAAFTFLYGASNINLTCDEESRTCIYNDIAPMKKIHKVFSYDEIKGGKADEHSYIFNKRTYYYYVTSLILSDDEILEVQRYEYKDKAKELALKFNNIAKVPDYNTGCNIKYKRKEERAKKAIIMIFMGLGAMVISGLNFFSKS